MAQYGVPFVLLEEDALLSADSKQSQLCQGVEVLGSVYAEGRTALNERGPFRSKLSSRAPLVSR
jgi:hypothetical protein